jgi:hypothetical protein
MTDLIINSIYIINGLLFGFFAVRLFNFSGHTHSSANYLYILSFAFVIIMLGIIRIFDIHLYLAGAIRHLSKNQGWYDHRYFFQSSVAAIIMTICIIFPVMINKLIPGADTYNLHTIWCLLLLVSYLSLVTVSFHPVDFFLAIKVQHIAIGKLIELAIIVSIFYSGIRHFYQSSMIINKSIHSPERKVNSRLISLLLTASI